MIKLDETEMKLAKDIDIIFSGGYDSSLGKDEVEYCKEFSFLYKHLHFIESGVLFKWNDIQYKILNIPDEELFVTTDMIKDQVLYSIRNSDEFKMAYKKFIRDYKIVGLLK